jgi:hypothetical protein
MGGGRAGVGESRDTHNEHAGDHADNGEREEDFDERERALTAPAARWVPGS